MGSLLAVYKQIDFGHMRITKPAVPLTRICAFTRSMKITPVKFFTLIINVHREEAARVRSSLMTKKRSNPSRAASRL